MPRTRLGKMVKEDKITSIDEIFAQVLNIREPQIVDRLVSNLEEEVIDINLVQRQTDAGEVSKFKATVVVGNRSGYIGLGEAKMKEIGPAIRAAINRAKLNLSPVKRGCGSWECEGGDSHTHSIPYEVDGKSGSVKISLKPAPRGVGLVAAKKARIVLALSGIKDVWSLTKGHTKTSANLAKATFDALISTYNVMTQKDWTK
ncbi:MAG: 30S ribosomal protein S5 [Candidatus Ranarchaeia archaeon]